jgi:hypothetical protein
VTWVSQTLDTEALFSQHFQVQQRLEDLGQEMVNVFVPYRLSEGEVVNYLIEKHGDV